jgi:molybdopterin converting factor small subunit
MKVNVRLHTILQRQTPEGLVNQVEVSLPDPCNLVTLLDHLEIALEPEALLLVVNGRTAELDQVLRDGDQVNLMPAISGGVIEL